MPNPVFSEERHNNVQLDEQIAQANAFLSSSVDALNRVITKHPGMALLISVSLGVTLACLSKRR
jgi:hypothetical protein